MQIIYLKLKLIEGYPYSDIIIFGCVFLGGNVKVAEKYIIRERHVT